MDKPNLPYADIKVRQALNLAVNKKAIIGGLWKGKGSETPYSYYYYPFHKGYSTEWKVPPYDPERASKLLAEAGVAGGFEVRVNPYVQLVAQDGPDVMEAVALDWLDHRDLEAAELVELVVRPLAALVEVELGD